MKKQSFITRFITFTLCFCLLFSSIPVQASGGYSRPTGWDSFSTSQKLDWYAQNGMAHLLNTVGIVLNPSGTSGLDYFNSYLNLKHERILADGSTSWDDYINSHFQVNADETGVTVSSEFVNDFRAWLKQNLEKESGFFMIPTLKVDDLPKKCFNSIADLTFARDIYKQNLQENNVLVCYKNNNVTPVKIWYFNIPLNSYHFVFRSSGANTNIVEVYDNGFNLQKNVFDVNGYQLDTCSKLESVKFSTPSIEFSSASDGMQFGKKSPITINGEDIRVFHSLDALKAYKLGERSYYATPSYYNYNSKDDNSVFTNEESYVSMDEYNSNCNNVYNYITENNVDEGISEGALALIIEEILNSTSSGGSGENNSGGSSGGSGLLDLINGLGQLLDFFLSLIGKLIGIISNFLKNVLDMLGNFTVFTDGFGAFLTEAFGFLPPEAVASISLGVTVIVLLAIIKFLKG